MRNVVDKVVETKHTIYVQYMFYENCAIYEIMLKTVAQPNRLHMTMCCCVGKMRFACRITKTIVQSHS